MPWNQLSALQQRSADRGHRVLGSFLTAHEPRVVDEGPLSGGTPGAPPRAAPCSRTAGRATWRLY